MGIDTGGGVGLDYTVGVVLDCHLPFEQCAIWQSNKIRPAEAAELLANMGQYYNNAFATVESNAIGAGLLDVLLHTHKYSNIYRKEEQLDSDPHVSDKFGWATTQTGKHLLLTEFQQAWREKAIILHDRTTIEEFCNYVYLKKQKWNPNQILKTGAIEGMHDDCVIATMLALHAAKLWPQEGKTKKSATLKNSQYATMLDRFTKKLKMRGMGKLKPEIM